MPSGFIDRAAIELSPECFRGSQELDPSLRLQHLQNEMIIPH